MKEIRKEIRNCKVHVDLDEGIVLYIVSASQNLRYNFVPMDMLVEFGDEEPETELSFDINIMRGIPMPFINLYDYKRYGNAKGMEDVVKETITWINQGRKLDGYLPLINED